MYIKINHRQYSLFSDWLHPGGVRTFLLSNWRSRLLWERSLISDWLNAAAGRMQLVEGGNAEQGAQRRGVEDAELTHLLRPIRTEYGEHREQKWVFGKLSHTRAKWIGSAGREMGSTACRCSRARGVILARWEFKPGFTFPVGAGIRLPLPLTPGIERTASHEFVLDSTATKL